MLSIGSIGSIASIDWLRSGDPGLRSDEYLDIAIIGAALIGAVIGFLWFNSFPASIFMGDTGSLGLGGAIAGSILAVQAAMWAAIWLATGVWYAYLVLWFLPWMTCWRVVNRLRSIAEHGGMAHSDDRRHGDPVEGAHALLLPRSSRAHRGGGWAVPLTIAAPSVMTKSSFDACPAAMIVCPE